MKPGIRLRSAVCDTEVVIVRAGAGALTCGGEEMVEPGGPPSGRTPQAGWNSGTQIGKRYEDTETGVQVLVVKPGIGTLGIDGRALEPVKSKSLPASD